jgi:glycerol-3-phosphate O-acyltransferase
VVSACFMWAHWTPLWSTHSVTKRWERCASLERGRGAQRLRVSGSRSAGSFRLVLTAENSASGASTLPERSSEGVSGRGGSNEYQFRFPIELLCASPDCCNRQLFTDAHSGVVFVERLEFMRQRSVLDAKSVSLLRQWYDSYEKAAMAAATDGALVAYGCGSAESEEVSNWCSQNFSTLFDILLYELRHPFQFGPYHKAVRGPEFNYTAFGNMFSRPLCNLRRSFMDQGSKTTFRRITEQLAAGDNVCLMGNHQSEADPFAIYHMFRHYFGESGAELAERTLYMAGDRVRDDPLAAPFSVGRSMLTVYSKKHILDEPDRRSEKQSHNRKTLQEMERLFAAGGQCVWFAPSGGRDRRAPDTGRVECAPFDPDAIELFRLSADRAGRPCHYYPMAIGTFHMLPPPDRVEKEKGEQRIVSYAPLWMSVMPEIDLDSAVGASLSKAEKRQARATWLYDLVVSKYKEIGAYDAQ